MTHKDQSREEVMTETISYMGQQIDICTRCDYDTDHCHCTDD